MGKIKTTGSSNPGVVTPQPETTSTPKPSESNSADGSSTPTAQETKSSQQLAAAKKEEFGLSLIYNTVNSALDSAKQSGEALVKAIEKKSEIQSEIQNVEQSARESGLEFSELIALSERLRGMDDKTVESEIKFLKNDVLNTPNIDRALRTYNELKEMQDNDPDDRLQDKHVQLLTKGVAQPRAIYRSESGATTAFPTGEEGVLGQDGAKKAAEALISIQEADYNVLNGLLESVGTKEDQKVIGSNPDLERVLILKAVGAHGQTLSTHSPADRAWARVGEPSAKMSEILFYAKDIRGEQGNKLAQQSTSIDPYLGNSSLQQRWDNSCGPATLQGMKAEIDPIYARKLHQEFIHNIENPKDKIGKEQKEILEDPGLSGNDSGFGRPKAVRRGEFGGTHMILENALNFHVSSYSGIHYSYHPVHPDRLDRAAKLRFLGDKLKSGVDIPIHAEVESPATGKRVGHFMLLTDVRGTDLDRKFLLTDPWEGKTQWISLQDLASGNTQFPNGRGEFKGAIYNADEV